MLARLIGSVYLAALVPAQAQLIQQGVKLSAADVAGAANQGSVAVSADGTMALVGGAADAGGVGAVWVWTRVNGDWKQQAKLVGTGAVGNARQGISVALSADGSTALAGGFVDNGGTGAAWVWRRRGSTWMQEGPKLVGSGASGIANQGYSVALSGDGDTALIGGYNDAGGVGAVWVWTRSGGVWTQQGGKLIGSGAVGRAYQGYAVALSQDGNTAIAGGFADNSSTGAVWVWTRTYNVWAQQGPKLVGTGAVGHASQGIAVALSASGQVALAGGFGDSSGTGAAWAWTRSSTGVWKQQGSKLVGTGAVGSAYQGVSVALSENGNTALIGGFKDNSGAGSAWVWTRTGTVWAQQGAKLAGTGALGNAGQGRGVALSSDGATAVLGGAFDDSGVGAAWVFVVPSDISGQVTVSQSDPDIRNERGTEYWNEILTVINPTENIRDQRGDVIIRGPINILITGLPENVELVNRTGIISGSPYISVPVERIDPGNSISVPLTFTNSTRRPISFKVVVYTGTGALY